MDGKPPAADDVPAPLEQHLRIGGVPEPRRSAQSGLRAYLFADIRGYTSYTAEHGAVQAAALVERFTGIARSVIGAHDGQLVATWGDEVLGEFDSASSAARASVELQRLCIASTLADPSTPLAVGIGLDAGEHAGAEDVRSGAGLNLAARLCARAGRGEILATAEVAHLAGALPDLRLRSHGRTSIKGVPERVHVVAIAPADRDRRAEALFRAVTNTRAERRRMWRRMVGAAVAAALLLGASVTWGVTAFSLTRLTIPPNGIVIVDARTGAPEKAIGIEGASDGSLAGIAAGPSEVWVTEPEAGRVVAVSRSGDNAQDEIPVGADPVALVVSGDDVWVVNRGDGTVSRISQHTMTVVQTVAVGNLPDAVALGFGSVWVADAGDATVKRVEASDGRVVATILVGDGPAGLVVADHRVWVANGRDDTVESIDPATNGVGAPISVGAGPTGLAASRDGALWVANSLDLTVSRIDPGQPNATASRVGDTPIATAAVDGAVWVANQVAGTLSRIDPNTQAVRTVPLGASPQGLAVVGDRIWVPTRPFVSAQHVGGTLRVRVAPKSAWAVVPDPATAYLSEDISTLALVYDGLLGYRRAPATAGYRLVPDLAQSIPRPSDGGLTYRFVLRSGIHYSDGRLVTPEDFRRGVEREFTATVGAMPTAGNPSYYTGIIGGDACVRTPRRCDLSQGITTSSNSVTFHLRHADSEFLYKMGLLFAPATPPGSPTTFVTTHAIPGTGPYRFASIDPGHSETLIRNPYYHQWSSAAQPPGYPDRIEITVTNPRAAVNDVTNGRADLTPIDPNAQGATLRELSLQAPDRIHVSDIAFTESVYLNTRRPPFDRVLARRAVAQAIDRATVAALQGGGAYVTCQVVPPDFPGYQHYCPYGSTPVERGVWRGPDLDGGRALVAASGTRGAAVNLYISKTTPSLGEYLSRLMRDLGYRPVLHLVDINKSYDLPSDSRTDSEVSYTGWGLDIPTASTFYDPVLSCASFVPASKSNNNRSEYCNRRLDRLAAQAEEMAPGNPGQAQLLWRQIYRGVIDDAPIIPTDVRPGGSYYTSARLGNWESGAYNELLLDQMWVR